LPVGISPALYSSMACVSCYFGLHALYSSTRMWNAYLKEYSHAPATHMHMPFIHTRRPRAHRPHNRSTRFADAYSNIM
jgi:hypothetical protein